MAVDQAICWTPQTDPASDLSTGPEPTAPWMEDVALQIWVDAEHSPILVRLTGTLNQATAVNVVPVVGELIADGGRAVEIQTPGLRVPDRGGTDALADVQRLVHRTGGAFTWDVTTLTSQGASREARNVVHRSGSHHDTLRIPGDTGDDLPENPSDQLDEEGQPSRAGVLADRVMTGRAP